MLKNIAVLLSMALLPYAAQCMPTSSNVVSDYTITPSSQLAYYHYPAPQAPSSTLTQNVRHSNVIQQSTSRQYQYPNQQQQRSPVLASSPIIRQFASPALESAAFSMALKNQGFGTGAGTSSKLIELRSLNIKLPVPIGVTPINIAPLPLQAGTPYSVLRGVTSYGTTYPQR